jgi:hypothetical protein
VKQNLDLAALSIQLGLKELGVKEATGKNDGKRVGVYQDFIDGDKSTWMKGQPWCAAFMSWCVDQAAKKLGLTPKLKKTASSSDIYAQAKKLGLVLDQPIPYCIGLIKGTGGSAGKTHHHTFRVLSVDLEHGLVHGLDGNWGNQVCKTVHPIAACDFVALA